MLKKKCLHILKGETKGLPEAVCKVLWKPGVFAFPGGKIRLQLGRSDSFQGVKFFFLYKHLTIFLGAVLLVSLFLLNLLYHTVGAVRVVLGHVQALVDAAWNGLDVGHQLFFDGLQVESVVWCDQVYGQTQVTKPPYE